MIITSSSTASSILSYSTVHSSSSSNNNNNQHNHYNTRQVTEINNEEDENINEQTIHDGDISVTVIPVTSLSNERQTIINPHQERQESSTTNQPTTVHDVIEEETTRSTIEQQEEPSKNQQCMNEKSKSSKATHFIHQLFGHSLFAVLLLIAAGSAVSFQSGMNAAMRTAAGRAFSSVTNFASGTLACLVLFILDLLILRTPPPRHHTFKESPWYAWMGGILGTFYIIVNIFLVPIHGAGTVLSIFVCAQVIAACIMDHFGLTGIKKRRYSIWRILASLGLIGCVAVITLF